MNRSTAAVLVFLAAVGLAQADVLVSYELSNAEGTPDGSPAESLDGLIAGNLTAVNLSSSGFTTTDDGHAFIRESGAPASLDLSMYWSFTLEAESGTFDVTGISLDSRVNNEATAANFVVRSSADNFSATLLSVATNSDTWSTFSEPVTGLDGQSSLEFRIYVFDGTGLDGNAPIRLDDIVVSGIPEPATVGVLAIGGLAALRRRRR